MASHTQTIIEGYFDLSPEAIVLLDSDTGTILSANRRFKESITPLDRVLSNHFTKTLIHAEDQDRLDVAFRSVVAKGANSGFTPNIYNCKTMVLGPDNSLPTYFKFDWVLAYHPGTPGIVVLSGRQVTIVRDHEKDAQAEFADFFNKAPLSFYIPLPPPSPV